MLRFLKRIIQHTLDFYKRVWQAFFIGSPALAGIAWLFKESHIIFLSLLILASICFVVALIGLYRDYKDARQKEKDKRKDEIRKALHKAVKRLNPEYTEEQIDWWINGK